MAYNHYPGDPNQYPIGTPDDYPFPKQDFQDYYDKQIITSSRSRDPLAPLMATSGTLMCRTYNGARTGFTDTFNFRMLCNPLDNKSQKLVRYTDTRTSYFGSVLKWHDGAPNWSGLHMFARYQTEENMYVASWRIDGNVTIKKKINGKYSTLAASKIGSPKIGSEHLMIFEAEGPLLSYYIDGNLIVQAEDKDLSWGTNGIRTDYSDNYIDYYKINSV